MKLPFYMYTEPLYYRKKKFQSRLKELYTNLFIIRKSKKRDIIYAKEI